MPFTRQITPFTRQIAPIKSAGFWQNGEFPQPGQPVSRGLDEVKVLVLEKNHLGPNQAGRRRAFMRVVPFSGCSLT